MIHEALDYIRRELRDRLTFEDADVMIDSARIVRIRGHYVRSETVGAS